MNTNKLRHYSIGKVVQIVLARYLGTEIRKMHYFRLVSNPEQIKKQLEGFDESTVLPLTLEMVSKGDPQVFRGEKLELYKLRLKDPNYYGYGIMENDQLVFSAWFSTQNLGLPLITKKIPLLPNEGLLEDAYCIPSARGRGLHPKMVYFRLKKLYELGKNRVLVVVLDGNTPAMKAPTRSGFEELGTFYIGRILGIKFCTLNKKIFDAK